MAIYALGDVAPQIDPAAYRPSRRHRDRRRHRRPRDSTVWPSAVLRGDYGSIVVGARTSVQDGIGPPRRARFPHHRGVGMRGRPPRPSRGVHPRRRVPGRVGGGGACTTPWSATGATVGAGAVVPRTACTCLPGALAVGIPATIKLGASDSAASGLPPRSTSRTAAATPSSCGASIERTIGAILTLYLSLRLIPREPRNRMRDGPRRVPTRAPATVADMHGPGPKRPGFWDSLTPRATRHTTPHIGWYGTTGSTIGDSTVTTLL